MKADDFQLWLELATGDEDRQLAPLIDVAQELKTTPAEIMRVAAALKRESGGQHGRPAQWLRGVPWFNVPTIALIAERLQAESAAPAKVRRESHTLAATTR